MVCVAKKPLQKETDNKNTVYGEWTLDCWSDESTFKILGSICSVFVIHIESERIVSACAVSMWTMTKEVRECGRLQFKHHYI